MKDRKQVLIGLAIVVVIAVIIALNRPKPAPEKNTRAEDMAPEQETKLLSDSPSTGEGLESVVDASDQVLSLIESVEDPADKIQVLTSLATAHLQAGKDASPVFEVLLSLLTGLSPDEAKLKALDQLSGSFEEFNDNDAFISFKAQLADLKQKLNPSAYYADKLTASIEVPSKQIRALAQIAVVLAQAGDTGLSTILLAKATELSAPLEEVSEQVTSQSALAIARLQLGQSEVAIEKLAELPTVIETFDSTEDQLAAYEKLAAELDDFSEQEAVVALLETVKAKVLKLKYQADPILRLVSGIEAPEGQVRVLCNLAGTLALTGDQKQSAQMILKSQEIIAQIEMPEQLAPALTYLAVSQSLTGQPDAAKATLAKALETVEGIESIDAKTAALGSLVGAVASMEDADQLQTVLAQSLKIANSIQKRAQMVMQQSLKLINQLPAGEQKAAAIQQIVQAMEQDGGGQFAELQFELATLYQEGRHLPRDGARAAAWYRKAAFAGHANARINLGVMLLEGDGLEADPVEAHQWLLLSAEEGDATGQVALGMMFALGQGTQPNLVQAYKWVTLSSKSGNEDAATALEQLTTKLSSEQLAEAAKLVKEWEAQQIEPEPKASEPAAKEPEPTTTAGK